MGPRSVERGNVNLLSSYASSCQLQWGRVRLNAETQILAPPDLVGRQASMGPRSVERGNTTDQPDGGPPLDRFNGAAFG